ncbi:TPA: hypothetical protein U1B35_001141 [Streptococcus suis]|uniref:YopX family protein n=1 Tax=Streptococcus suis TaxID=1307 RepID=UPI000D65FF75|nr:YopX family protein [Streptococcus suis]AWL26810.1 hypothetical protein DF184_09790 [Streptococcus suis]HEM3537462.1 hypothetical protein [Streptococcus suis]
MIPKFRAWDIFHNKWVKHFYITENGLIYNMEQLHRDLIGAVPIEQSGLIVMQSTGLFDVNGKEIFEGDVVLLRDELNEFESDVYEIVYSRDNLAWIFYDKDSHDFYWMSTCTWDEIEIIGNIYENPELMEVLDEK